MTRHFINLPTGFLLGALTLASCPIAAADSFEFTAIDEIPEGEGLVTDSSGEFTLFKWEKTRKDNAGADQPVQTPGQTITSTSGITDAPTPE